MLQLKTKMLFLPRLNENTKNVKAAVVVVRKSLVSQDTAWFESCCYNWVNNCTSNTIHCLIGWNEESHQWSGTSNTFFKAQKSPHETTFNFIRIQILIWNRTRFHTLTNISPPKHENDYLRNQMKIVIKKTLTLTLTLTQSLHVEKKKYIFFLIKFDLPLDPDPHQKVTGSSLGNSLNVNQLSSFCQLTNIQMQKWWQ